MQKNPHMLIEGMIIAAYAAGATRSFIYIRGEYELQADILDAAIAEADGGRLPRRAHPRLRPLAVAVGAPRRRRLHLRRGDRRCSTRSRASAATRASSRRSPPTRASTRARRSSTTSRRSRPCPRSSRMGGEEYAKIGVENSTGTKLVSVSGNVQRPGNYEIELGISSREIIYGLAGGPPEGREVKLWFPGGSSSPVLTERRPRPPLRLRHAGQGRLDARLRRDHRRRRLELGRRRRAEDSRSSTATSRAASARRAARARTGP